MEASLHPDGSAEEDNAENESSLLAGEDVSEEGEDDNLEGGNNDLEPLLFLILLDLLRELALALAFGEIEVNGFVDTRINEDVRLKKERDQTLLLGIRRSWCCHG